MMWKLRTGNRWEMRLAEKQAPEYGAPHTRDVVFISPPDTKETLQAWGFVCLIDF